MFSFYIVNVILSFFLFIYLNKIDEKFVLGMRYVVSEESFLHIYKLIFLVIITPVLNTIFLIGLIARIIIYHYGNKN